MIVLGIETSCDETAAAVVRDDGTILSNIVLSQIDAHTPYGGVVPEIAARAHVEAADIIVEQAMTAAEIGFEDLDAVAATAGPGLIGGVIVGTMTGKAIASAHALPFIAVNHLEAHALTARLTHRLSFPYLLLLVSGGHTQLLVAEDVGHYRRLGTTIDDAAGEAFDKTAKMLGLGFPGGPAVEKTAQGGNASAFTLPRPMTGRDNADFSFSGLKTAVRQTIESLPPGPVPDQTASDLCASFETAVAAIIEDRVSQAMEMCRDLYGTVPPLVVAGGVAANTAIRKALLDLAERENIDFIAPPAALCTDNGAMIAWAGIEKYRLGQTNGLDFKPRPRWPLDETR